MGDDARRDAQVRGVEAEDALDVGKHQAVERRPVVLGRGRRVVSILLPQSTYPTAAATTTTTRHGDDPVARQGNDRLGGDDAAHGVAAEDHANRGIDGGRRGALGDLDIDNLLLQPVPEAGDAVGQATAGFVFRVDEDLYVKFWEEDRKVLAEVLGEGIFGAKSLFTPLYSQREEVSLGGGGVE